VSALVNDATAVLDALAATELDEKAARAVALLALIAGQDVEPDNHEAVVGLELLAGGDARLEVLGDTAYGTGQARADLTAAGHPAIIKPGPLRPAFDGGFTIDDFTVSEADGTATCPNGITRRIPLAASSTLASAARPAR
jgi:hypothetical protein